MKPSWDDIKQWNAGAVGQLGDVLAKARNRTTSLQDEMDGATVPAQWTGDAAEAAAVELDGHRQDLEVLVAEISAMGSAVDEAEQGVESIRQQVTEAEDLASAHGFRIDNGMVVDQAPDAWAPLDLGRSLLQSEIAEKIAATLRKAEEVDAELTTVIDKILAGRISDGAAATLADAAALGAMQGSDQLHDELLAKYQVAADPRGMTEWPNGVTGWLWEQLGKKKTPVTPTEAAMLDDLQDRQGLLGVKELADIRQDALNRGEKVFDGQGGTDGHSDAFRHAYWNALMAQRFGDQWAAELATAHERNPASHPTPVAMDLHNNEVGRQIAKDHPDASPDELAGLIETAVREGKMVVVGQDDQLTRSDQTGFGETRSTGPGNDWPTGHPERRGHRTPEDPSAYPERG